LTGALLALGLLVGGLTSPRAEDATPVLATRTFSGSITAKTTDLLSVDTNIFNLSKDTLWFAQDQALPDSGQFDVGDMVVVKATPKGSGWNAAEVHLMANVVPDQGSGNTADTPAQGAAFTGPIESVGTNALTVESTVLAFDNATKWIVGDQATTDLSQFNVGDQVVATASFDGKGWRLSSVELLVNASTNNPAAANPTGTVPAVQSFGGMIRGISDTSLDLADMSFLINDQTQWANADGTAAQRSSFGVGDTVQVIATQNGAIWTASKVTLIQHTPPLGSAPRPR
jgi:hypothetical protein